MAQTASESLEDSARLQSEGRAWGRAMPSRVVEEATGGVVAVAFRRRGDGDDAQDRGRGVLGALGVPAVGLRFGVVISIGIGVGSVGGGCGVCERWKVTRRSMPQKVAAMQQHASNALPARSDNILSEILRMAVSSSNQSP